MGEGWLEGLPKRTRALLVLGAGIGAAALVASGRDGGNAGAVVQLMTPVCLLLGAVGLVRPEIVGKDHEITPSGRRWQIAVVIVGMALGSLRPRSSASEPDFRGTGVASATLGFGLVFLRLD